MVQPMRPDELTLDFAPRRADGVHAVEVEGEMVVYEPRTGQMHKLNAVATVLWNSFDGTTTLAELSDDLASIYPEQGLDRLREDVLRYACQLGEAGVLGNVRSDDAEPSDG